MITWILCVSFWAHLRLTALPRPSKFIWGLNCVIKGMRHWVKKVTFSVGGGIRILCCYSSSTQNHKASSQGNTAVTRVSHFILVLGQSLAQGFKRMGARGGLPKGYCGCRRGLESKGYPNHLWYPPQFPMVPNCNSSS